MARSAPLRRAAALVVAGAIAGPALAACSSDEPAYVDGDCERADDARSVARRWNEAALGLIRQVIPAPTEHARNLFHLSAAMWDAWAAYDDTADGYFVDEQRTADDVSAARETAISFAAHRLLAWRYGTVADLPTAIDELDEVMASVCLRPDHVSLEGDDPAALGDRIARTIIDGTRDDGALEDERYVDHSYRPVNEPLVVDEPGAEMIDPNAWQPLSLGVQIAQNGLPIPGQVQEFQGPHWGSVTPFALPPSADGLPLDPGPPPRLGASTDAAFERTAVEVIRFSSELDPGDRVEIDISPGAIGGNTIGSNDGTGHEVNPSTGRPYEPQVVLRADFNRAIAEYWADGPESETPPGHWNLFANAVADAPGFERRVGGEGPQLDPLEWDVKAYFALNGALHDAAVAAWGTKGFYDSARPISMIRYLGGRGQSTDPDAPSYDPDGLPLVPDLVEVVTVESSAPGQRHEALVEHVGDIAIRAWRGSPDDPETQTSGVGWIRAVDWVPYQRPSFVSPAFAGYVSGHSTFSRAGAEVLTALTGSPYFPGGLAEWTVERGSLLHEEGPTADLTLQWATYRDAADQAGISRLHGGIHIAPDDLAGRRMGAECGERAWQLAERYFEGTARP